MVDLRSLRHEIRTLDAPTSVTIVSRRWLERVERDLTELELRRSREHFNTLPKAVAGGRQ